MLIVEPQIYRYNFDSFVVYIFNQAMVGKLYLILDIVSFGYSFDSLAAFRWYLNAVTLKLVLVH